MRMSDEYVIFRLQSLAEDSEAYHKADPENLEFEKDRDACLIAAERMEKAVPCRACRFWGDNLPMHLVCNNRVSPCFGRKTGPYFFCAAGRRR